MTPSFTDTLARLRRMKDSCGTGRNPQSRYRFFECETPESIAAVEQTTGMPVPPDLNMHELAAGHNSQAPRTLEELLTPYLEEHVL